MAILYLWSGAAGTGSGADWTNAKTTFSAAFTTEVAGDTIYVAHDHAEVYASGGTLTLASSGTSANVTKVICVNRAGSVPPVSADRRATAQFSMTGTATLAFTGFTHYDGIIFIAGTGFGSNIFAINTTSQRIRFDNCSLRLAAQGSIGIGNASTAAGSFVELNNTTLNLGNVSSNIAVAATLLWRNTPSALLGTIPTSLFDPTAARGGSAECIGVDLSAAGSGKTIVGAGTGSPMSYYFKFVDCKLDAAVTKSAAPSMHGSTFVDFIRSGASGNYAVHSHRHTGLLTEETTIVRTGGATDGTTPIAWKIVTTADANYSNAFETPPIAIWNDTTGSAVTATVEGIAATLPTDAECWLDVEYLGDASSPQGSFVNDGKADLIIAAANQTTSTETWGGSTAKFKMAVTFTPQQKGWIYARVKVGKASSTFYLDPLVTLS